MTNHLFGPPGLGAVCERGRRYVPVPWERADELHRRLKGRGFPTTLCLDPGAREARLELWPGVDPDRLGVALAA